MRSGLQKPGAVPFLALLIFSLLSLVPTLAKEWNFYGYSYSAHFTYLGLPRASSCEWKGSLLTDLADSSPRVRNASSTVDSRSRSAVTGSHCRPWFFGDVYSSFSDNGRDARPHQSAVHTPPRSLFGAGVEAGDDPVTYSATKRPLSITRGVSAVKEFIRRWDDQQMSRPLPPRHDPFDDTSAHPMLTLANTSVTPASLKSMQRQPTPEKLSDGAPARRFNVDSWLSRLPSLVHETWQQVCNTGARFLESWTTRLPVNYSNETLIPKYRAPHTSDGQRPPEHFEELDRASTRESLSTNLDQPRLAPRQTDSRRTLSPKSLKMTAGQSKYTGFQRDSDHICGSSMAIVIALMYIMEDSHFRHSASHHPSPFQSNLPRDHSLTGGTTTALEEPTAQHRSSYDIDEEGQPPRYTEENDPYQLASKLKSDAEIQALHPQANTSRKRHGHTTTTTPQPARSTSALSTVPTLSSFKSSMARKELQGFYQTQNENIERMLKPVEEHVRDARELNTNNQLKYKIAIYGSFAANVVLSILQLYGAVASSSLSLFTTMADSVFDPLSNLTLLLCNKTVNRVDPRKFPAGKARIETAGNICFCFLMTAVSLLLIAFSIRDLVGGSDSETGDFHLPSVIAVVVAFCTKFSLFVYCFALRNQVSQIRILWEDHRNDLFINGFGILTSVGGSKLRWWIDPMGAIILSVLISGLWLHTAYHEFQLLIGITADTKMQQLITYISMTHSPLITAIDTVRAYTSGPRLVVEVDIVMDPSESLRATHDVAEELQTKLESLPDVERAYVHVDYETTHKPEHFLKKEL
ncbi:hypothetical protein BDV11DRAFT_202347 [Aspergillus similis]